ncbi:hypothetical protein V1477_006822 [Vespula maculifrons]|uniref:Uncharacterized protein n=1 Tax=Vespula maculifrons TaxID=7453 RepID=A0ABD2CHI8_VESMC
MAYEESKCTFGYRDPDSEFPMCHASTEFGNRGERALKVTNQERDRKKRRFVLRIHTIFINNYSSIEVGSILINFILEEKLIVRNSIDEFISEVAKLLFSLNYAVLLLMKKDLSSTLDLMSPRGRFLCESLHVRA